MVGTGRFELPNNSAQVLRLVPSQAGLNVFAMRIRVGALRGPAVRRKLAHEADLRMGIKWSGRADLNCRITRLRSFASSPRRLDSTYSRCEYGLGRFAGRQFGENWHMKLI